MARIKVLVVLACRRGVVARRGCPRGQLHGDALLRRRPPSELGRWREYVNGSLLTRALAKTVENADVVFDHFPKSGDMEGRGGNRRSIITRRRRRRTTPECLGGVSSVLVSEGGPRLFDAASRSQRSVEIKNRTRRPVEAPRSLLETLDWFYVSPAAMFGAWYPQRVTGEYRISDTRLV